jgi:carbon-monoxide dehydrogenase medium subunit
VAESADHALALLTELDGTGRVIAGGTDLMLDQRTGSARVLVDISRLPEWRSIEQRGDRIHVGALCTHNDLATSALLQERAAALSLAAAAVGSPQIRVVGTVGGNVVNALPAADTAIALAALGATAEVRSAAGTREADLLSLYAGVGKSTIDPTREILTGFSFPIPSGSGFKRLARRKALALPVLNVAAAVWMDDGLACSDVRISIGPVAPAPWRALEAEHVLRGSVLTRETISRAAHTAMATAVCRDSIRACSLYRQSMVQVLVRRALLQALEGSGHE